VLLRDITKDVVFELNLETIRASESAECSGTIIFYRVLAMDAVENKLISPPTKNVTAADIYCEKRGQ
jgi:hypothetical protein